MIFFFSDKIRLGILCESSARRPFTYQAQFSLKNNKKKMLSAAVLNKALRVNVCCSLHCSGVSNFSPNTSLGVCRSVLVTQSGIVFFFSLHKAGPGVSKMTPGYIHNQVSQDHHLHMCSLISVLYLSYR